MPETMTRREGDDVARALRPWLASRLGQDVDDLNIRAPQGHGFSNDTFFVTAAAAATRLDVVVQAAPTGAGLFPDYSIERMAAIQRGLRDHSDVPVASVRWFEGDATVLGAPFYVMDRADGSEPDESPRPYHTAGWVAEATTAQRRQLWTSVLDAMARLHRVEVSPHFDHLTGGRWGMAVDADPAATRVHQWREYTVWAADDDAPTQVLMDAWDHLAASTPPPPPRRSISWGDAKLGNVMFDAFEVVALLDWELCGISAAEEDLMNWLAVDQVLADVKKTRADGFLTYDETVAAYADLLQRDLVGTQWWYAFALAKMGAEVDRILRRSKQLGALPDDLDLVAVNSALPRLRDALNGLGGDSDAR